MIAILRCNRCGAPGYMPVQPFAIAPLCTKCRDPNDLTLDDREGPFFIRAGQTLSDVIGITVNYWSVVEFK